MLFPDLPYRQVGRLSNICVLVRKITYHAALLPLLEAEKNIFVDGVQQVEGVVPY